MNGSALEAGLQGGGATPLLASPVSNIYERQNRSGPPSPKCPAPPTRPPPTLLSSPTSQTNPFTATLPTSMQVRQKKPLPLCFCLLTLDF